MNTIIFLLFTTFTAPVYAQINILDVIADGNRINLNTMAENGDYYYLIKEKKVGSSNTAPTELTMCKYNKYNLQLINSVVFAGDTTSIDSAVTPFGLHMLVNNGRISVTYLKFKHGDNNEIYFDGYFTQLDTNLNIIIPEKIIDSLHQTANNQHFSLRHDNSFMLSFMKYIPNTQEAGMISKYLFLDSIGNTIKCDTFNKVPLTLNAGTRHLIIEAFPNGNNQYFVNGQSMTSLLPQPNQQSAYIADSNMNIIKEMYIYHSAFSGASFAVPLPTGSIVIGGEYDAGEEREFPFLGKNAANADFSFNDTILYNNIDANDNMHNTIPAYHCLDYNNYDNKVYLTTVSHRNLIACQNNIDYSYLDIVSADTNLIPYWHKYIRFNRGYNGCVMMSKLVKPYNRGGIIIMGAATLADTLYPFIYYITDTTETEDPGISSINDNSVLAGQIDIYPNPAADYFVIEDKRNRLMYFSIKNSIGSNILEGNINGDYNRVSIQSIPPGIYFLSVKLSDGKIVYKKIIKI